MLTGDILRTRTLTDSCGKPHTITILRPAATPENRASLLDSEKVWRAQMLAQPVGQLQRAKLAVDTAFSAANALGFARDVHYILAAQDETGQLRGLITFLHWTARQEWEIPLLTVSPADQGGSGAPCTLRGVGSELTGAAAQIMSTKACLRTVLSPLDEQARQFYIRRGFTCPTTVVDKKTGRVKLEDCVLSCPGLTALAATYAHSPTDDEDMVVGAPPASMGAQSWNARPNLAVVDYEGEYGNRQHITRVERGTVPTSAVAGLGGVKGERPGEHRNRQGPAWDAFLADIRANGIRSPIFITVDPGAAPRISEGNHRRDAAVQLGMPTVPVEIRYYGHAERTRSVA